MKTRPNPFALLLRLAIVVEMVFGTFCFPSITLAGAPRDIPSVSTLQSGNHAPVAVDDPAHTCRDTAVTIDVLANDDDADGDVLTAESVTPPGHGHSAVTNNGNNVIYIENP